jgi:hypothetical protein
MQTVRSSQARSRIQARHDVSYKPISAHGCKDCGERDYRKLEFDHLSVKNFSPFRRAHQHISKLDAEIALCEVVCCNCHQLRTLQRADSYRWRLWQSEHEQYENDAIGAAAA